MPANPSSWAWKLALRRRSANGDRSNISRHQRTVSSSSAASGTTVLTSPISSASSAEYILQRNHISLAFFGPTRLVRTDAPNPPSKLPTLGPTCPNFALSAAMLRSHTTCRTCPPPTAYPATIATTGLGQRRIWTCKSVTWKRPTDSPPGVRRGASGSSRYPASPLTFWSPPESGSVARRAEPVANEALSADLGLPIRLESEPDHPPDVRSRRRQQGCHGMETHLAERPGDDLFVDGESRSPVVRLEDQRHIRIAVLGL